VTVTLSVNVWRCRPYASQAKVTDLECATKVDEDVRRLQIKMNESVIVDMLEALCTC
jgi:hypothetical protein